MFHELRIATRSLSRRPLWTATIAATLAIGLGAAAALFVVVDLVFLEPLPYNDPDELALSWSTVTRDEVERRTYSWPDYLDLAAHVQTNPNSAIAGLAAFDQGNFVFDAPASQGGALTRIDGAVVSPEYFPLLGITPVLGTGFTGASHDPPGSRTPELILSYDMWQNRFAGRTEIVGETLRVDRREHVVVGVLPADFEPLVEGAEVWGSMLDLGAAEDSFMQNRGARWLDVLIRLAPGDPKVIEQRAREEMATVFSRLEAAFPDDNQGYSADLGSLRAETVGVLGAPVRALSARCSPSG